MADKRRKRQAIPKLAIRGLGTGIERPLAPTMKSLMAEDPRLKSFNRGIRRERR